VRHSRRAGDGRDRRLRRHPRATPTKTAAGSIGCGPVPRARVLVISTPYYEGRHWALSPSEFKPLLAQLEALHRKGFVHGDIRCFNTAFGAESRLFDCDCGGRASDGSSLRGAVSPRGGANLVCAGDEGPSSNVVPLAAVARHPLRYRQDLADGSRVSGRAGTR
jgi:hypothetical protein